ncbi:MULTISPECIES: zinc-binding dehydrogenase [Nocardioides]|uniref:zinc-binding dehydrogenase n=1 Tax=Nocardioides TaxID=1839 RepID=UPI0009EA007A
MRARGVAHGISCRSTPEWGCFVAKALGSVDKVIVVVEAGTLEQSMQALRVHGEVGLIRVRSSDGRPDPLPPMLTGGSLRGVYVGSAAMAKRLNAAVDATVLKPVIGARFEFDQAHEAFEHASWSDRVGKISHHTQRLGLDRGCCTCQGGWPPAPARSCVRSGWPSSLSGRARRTAGPR